MCRSYFVLPMHQKAFLVELMLMMAGQGYIFLLRIAAVVPAQSTFIAFIGFFLGSLLGFDSGLIFLISLGLSLPFKASVYFRFLMNFMTFFIFATVTCSLGEKLWLRKRTAWSNLVNFSNSMKFVPTMCMRAWYWTKSFPILRSSSMPHSNLFYNFFSKLF